MKKLLLFYILLPSLLFGQELKIDEETGLYSKSSIIEIQDQTKNEIYKNAIEWIALNYNSADDVIQLKDEERGKIIVKGNFSTGLFKKQGWIRHTLILEFKDNKFRYIYTNLSYYSTGSGDMPLEKNMISKKKVLIETEKHIDNSIESLTNYIVNNKANDDW